MSRLLAVGKLPPVSRGRSGRRPGKWRGHEDIAEELRELAAKQADPEDRWAMIESRVLESKAQAIVSAIRRGQAVGFEYQVGTSGGWFEAGSRMSKDQSGAPTDDKTGKSKLLYDVWARYVPGKMHEHEDMGAELRDIARNQPDPEDRWGTVAVRLSETRARAIASAIRRGQAVGFEHQPGADGGLFEAQIRLSKDQSGSPLDRKTGALYDVWVRYVPASEGAPL